MSCNACIVVLAVAMVFALCLSQPSGGSYGGTGTGTGNGTGNGTGTGTGTSTGTGNGTDIQVFMDINCTQEAIYYTAAYLKYKCVFFNKQICYDNFEKCVNTKGYDTKKAAAICEQQIGPDFLSATNEDCEAPPSNYLNALKSTCCTKTKIVEQVPSVSFADTQDILESCYDKVNCPGTDSCSQQTQTNSSTTDGGNMGAMGDTS